MKKQLLLQSGLIEKKIAILGGSSTPEVKDILELFLLRDRIKPSFYESDYNMFYENVMFDNQDFFNFNPDIVYIHTTKMNITEYPALSSSESEVQIMLNKEMSRFKALWEKISSALNSSIIQNNFELPYYRILGNSDTVEAYGKTNFITRLNQEFTSYAKTNTNFYINDIHYLSAWIGLERWLEKSFWFSYRYAVNYDAIPFLAHNICKIVRSILGKNKKCLVMDLDNTLWGGVIGDDGLDGISIGKGSPVAEAYAAFQKYIKELKEKGVILAVCSKNELANAKEGFSHPDSILKTEDFSAFKANWNPKPQNIIEIAQEINIGLDSIIFIDDDPVEREIVKLQLPAVTAPDLGKDVTKYIEIIDKEGYFETASITEEDFNRNKYYESDKKRYEVESKLENYNDFLLSLSMTAEIGRFSPVYLKRITQLTNKTNQFNLTTRRYNISEIEDISKNNEHITLYGKLSDKFGDNGLVTVVIGKVKENQLNIDLWLMSCRVFKRDLEYAMFDALMNECIERDILKINGYYFKTAKNHIVADFYEKLGFKLVTNQNNGDTAWEYFIDKSYKKMNRFIKVKYSAK